MSTPTLPLWFFDAANKYRWDVAGVAIGFAAAGFVAGLEAAAAPADTQEAAMRGTVAKRLRRAAPDRSAYRRLKRAYIARRRAGLLPGDQTAGGAA